MERRGYVSKQRDQLPIKLFLEGRRYDKEIFYAHPIYQEIKDRIISGANTFIIGNSLSGKSRAAYEAIKLCHKDEIIIVLPEHRTVELPSNSDAIFYIDDLDSFFFKQDIDAQSIFDHCNAYKIQWVATCRTGPEFNTVVSNLLPKTIENLYDSIIRIPLIDTEDYKFINFLKQNNISNIDDFDLNIGSLFLPLLRMRLRFQSMLNNNENDIAIAMLRGLKLHYHLFNYEINKSTYSEHKIKVYCQKVLKRELTPYEWDKAKMKITMTDTSLNFIRDSQHVILIETAYLDCKDNGYKDVIDGRYTKDKINYDFKNLYTDLYEAHALGFPMHISDYNLLIEQANSYEEAQLIFDQLPKNVIPIKHTFILLIKKAKNTASLKEIYKKLISFNINPNKIINSAFYNKVTDFNELIDLILTFSPAHLKSTNTNVSLKILQVAKRNKEENLKILFAKFGNKTVYNTPLLNILCSTLCTTEENYNEYVKPFIDFAHTLDFHQFRRFVQLCLTLKQNDLVVYFLNKYFKDIDQYFYYKTMGDCVSTNDPYQALVFYEMATDVVDSKYLQICAANSYGSLVYNNQIKEKIDEALILCRKTSKNTETQIFPQIKQTIALLIIFQTPIERLADQLPILKKQLAIGNVSFFKIQNRMILDDKKNIVENFMKKKIIA